MMSGEQGGGTERSRSQGSIQPACDPFKARLAGGLSRPAVVVETVLEAFGSRLLDEALSIEAF